MKKNSKNIFSMCKNFAQSAKPASQHREMFGYQHHKTHGYQHQERTSCQQYALPGYLTVYTALTMAVLLSLCLTLIEGVRQNTIRLEIECAMDIGMNNILAEYHRELQKQYNLFYIDTSYGTNNASYLHTQTHLHEYVEQNLGTDQKIANRWFFRDLLGMHLDRTAVTGIAIATDANGEDIRKQAIQVVKSDVGLSLLEETAARFRTLEAYGLGDRNVASEKENVDKKIEKYDGIEKAISETETTTINIDNPTDAIETKRSKGILQLVIPNSESISQRKVSLTSLVSQRRKNNGISQGNMEQISNSDNSDNSDSIMNRMLFLEYLLRYCGHYGKTLEKNRLQYQLEYLIAGKDNDVDNLKSVVYRISAIREAANVVYLYSDTAKCAEADALSITLASAMLVPEIAPLLKTTIILGWAYAESLYDVQTLLSGGKIPLLKSASDWHCGLQSIYSSEQEKVVSKQGTGLDYEDYLRLLLLMTDLEMQTFRFMDIVELEIRSTPGNRAFRMDGCVGAVTAEAEISSSFGRTFQITRSKGYD
jgi:hypothetical protein